MEKPKIIYPVIVEGKYDKIKLSSLFSAHIITTEGFGIFKRSEKAALLRALAKESKLIVLTDSDGAGKLIRSHLKGILPQSSLIQLYIPKVEGKEKRKTEASAEGTLGVEGMKKDILYELLLPYTKESDEKSENEQKKITKADLYEDGLTGREDSKAKRDSLAVSLGLPPDMTPTALLEALNLICPYEKYVDIIKKQ